MGEFQKIAERIAECIGNPEMIDQLGIEPLDIPEIVGGPNVASEINCYPGIPGYACCSLAVFVSLQSPAYIKSKKKHLSCNNAMEKVVQHMQGKCNGITNSAVFITDNWDPEAYAKWRSNLKEIRASAYLEIYLIVGNKVTEIKFE